jgi:hypothetical protein
VQPDADPNALLSFLDESLCQPKSAGNSFTGPAQRAIFHAKDNESAIARKALEQAAFDPGDLSNSSMVGPQQRHDISGIHAFAPAREPNHVDKMQRKLTQLLSVSAAWPL